MEALKLQNSFANANRIDSTGSIVDYSASFNNNVAASPYQFVTPIQQSAKAAHIFI